MNLHLLLADHAEVTRGDHPEDAAVDIRGLARRRVALDQLPGRASLAIVIWVTEIGSADAGAHQVEVALSDPRGRPVGDGWRATIQVEQGKRGAIQLFRADLERVIAGRYTFDASLDGGLCRDSWSVEVCER